MNLPTAAFVPFLVTCLWSLNTETQVQASVGLYGPDRYEGLPDICLMPMDFGYCRAKVQRYYFDIRRMKCTMFYWGGCAGNDNNFKSMEECHNFCTSAYEDSEVQNEIVAKQEPTNVREPTRGGSNSISSRDSSVAKSVPKFALKANGTAKETGYKSQFKASAKSFNVAPKIAPTAATSSRNDDKTYVLDSSEDDDYDD